LKRDRQSFQKDMYAYILMVCSPAVISMWSFPFWTLKWSYERIKSSSSHRTAEAILCKNDAGLCTKVGPQFNINSSHDFCPNSLQQEKSRMAI
jgi:hypothetical protein